MPDRPGWPQLSSNSGQLRISDDAERHEPTPRVISNIIAERDYLDRMCGRLWLACILLALTALIGWCEWFDACQLLEGS